MCWFALQELSATNLANKLTIASLYLPPHRDYAWPPASLPSLVRVVIDVRVTAFLRKRAAIARIVNDDIGVAAELDRALAGVEPEQLGRLCRARIHHRLQPQSPRGDAAGVDQVDTFLDRGDPVGDFCEPVHTHFLLIGETEWRVIGGDRADLPRLDAVPQDVLVRLGAQRRRHHV